VLCVGGKVNVSLSRHHAMKAHRGNGGKAPHFLNLGTRCWWVVCFTHWVWDWLCPSAIVDEVVRRKIPAPDGIEPPHSQSLYQLSYPSSNVQVNSSATEMYNAYKCIS